MKLKLNTPKYIIGTYFDTELSMFGLAPSATEKGAPEGPKGPWGPEGPLSPQQELEGEARSALNF